MTIPNDDRARPEALRAEWERQVTTTIAPDFSNVKQRHAQRIARRNAAFAGAGALVLAVSALGVGTALRGGDEPRETTVASGGAPSARPDAGDRTAGSDTRGGPPPYSGMDPTLPPAPTPGGSALERLRAMENARDVPIPGSMPRLPGGLADAATTAAFAAQADQIFVFTGRNVQITAVSPPSAVTATHVVEIIKGSVVPPVTMRLTGSQSPTGQGSSTYLMFAADGSALALYTINGAYAQQVPPVKVSAPNMIRIDELRTQVAKQAGSPG